MARERDGFRYKTTSTHKCLFQLNSSGNNQLYTLYQLRFIGAPLRLGVSTAILHTLNSFQALLVLRDRLTAKTKQGFGAIIRNKVVKLSKALPIDDSSPGSSHWPCLAYYAYGRARRGCHMPVYHCQASLQPLENQIRRDISQYGPALTAVWYAYVLCIKAKRIRYCITASRSQPVITDRQIR
eukprot:6173853-Pleurochrysis_carterae.AAC.1